MSTMSNVSHTKGKHQKLSGVDNGRNYDKKSKARSLLEQIVPEVPAGGTDEGFSSDSYFCAVPQTKKP